MSNVVDLRFRGTVEHRAAASELLEVPGDAVLVHRERPRLLVLACPCGCGEQFPINLDARSGAAWRIYWRSKYGRRAAEVSSETNSPISVFPSIWRDDGCRSHYVIWNDRILLFGAASPDFDVSASAGVPTAEQVLGKLPREGVLGFADIADALEAVPWDVLQLCRALVKAGRAREGTGEATGAFGKVPDNPEA